MKNMQTMMSNLQMNNGG
jgi:Cyclin, N-terminal domain